MNLYRFAFDNLVRRPARTVLTIFAISLGVAAIVALTSIAWGFEASWQKANDSRGTDLIVTRLSSENAMPSAFVAASPQQAIAAMPHVRQVVGLLSEMLSVGDSGPAVFVFGWAHGSYLWEHLRLVNGRWPAADSEPVVVIGAMAAELLHKQVGGQIEIEGHRFPVAGIFESDAVVENGAVLMTLSQMQAVIDKPGKVNVLNIKLDAGATDLQAQTLRSTVRETMPGYVAITSGELVKRNTVVRISKAMSQATVLIACLVGALVVFNTMLMSVNERTREVGLLLALGWQKQTVMQLIICEATMLTLAGGGLGILLGLGFTVGLEHVDLLRGKITALYSFPFLAGMLGLSALLGICGGLYPALKAAALRPAQALRHE
jgi:putative ABC transport system permease protein